MAKTHKHNNILGTLYMLLHTMALSILYAIVKDITKELSSNTVVFFYKAVLLVMILPWCFVGGISSLKTTRIWLHISRGCLSTLGALCLFYALKNITLSDVVAIQYLEHVLLLVIGILYFSEKITKTKIFVIVCSFLGAIVIMRPDLFDVTKSISAFTQGFNWHYIFVFMAITFWALNSTVIKVLGKTEKTKVQLFYVMLFSTIISFPVAFMHWGTITSFSGLEIKYPNRFIDLSELGFKIYHIKYILILALCYLLHVIGHFKALKHAEISFVVPFEYTRLVFAGIFGFLLFKEVPSYVSYIGYILIIGSGLLLIKAESKKLNRIQFKQNEAES